MKSFPQYNLENNDIFYVKKGANFGNTTKRYRYPVLWFEILTNDNGDVQLVIGASGGERITTAVSLVCLMASYFEHEKIKGRTVHPPYRSYSQVYYFLVIFRSVPISETP